MSNGCGIWFILLVCVYYWGGDFCAENSIWVITENQYEDCSSKHFRFKLSFPISVKCEVLWLKWKLWKKSNPQRPVSILMVKMPAGLLMRHVGVPERLAPLLLMPSWKVARAGSSRGRSSRGCSPPRGRPVCSSWILAPPDLVLGVWRMS